MNWQAFIVAFAGGIFSCSISFANCYNVPQCYSTTQYVNHPYQQNICQFNGRQRWCYVATRSNFVPMTTQHCQQHLYCEGGLAGVIAHSRGTSVTSSPVSQEGVK
jgi:hypothetical protein